MEKFKQALKKTLFPHPILLILTTTLSIVGLTYIFTQHAEEKFYAPIIYVLSFYALCTIIARIVPLTKRIKNGVFANKHTSRYFSEEELRARISLYVGTILNITFAVFKFITGICYNSDWFIEISIYYAVLSIIRFILIYKYRQNKKRSDNTLLHGWKSYRLCGYLLLLLNTTASVMVFRMILQNKSFSYPGFIIYAMAAYTFYRLTMTIIKLVKAKKNTPILLAAKAFDLSISLVAVFSLQTALFTAFGENTTEQTRLIMNTFTGCAICLSVVCIAIAMIIKSNKKINFLNRRN